jgi:hypothetical protein
MSIQYSGGPNVHYTFVGSTKATIITAVQTQLVSCGWTVISGSGTTDVILQSVLTPQNLQLKMRVWDAGGATVHFYIGNTSGSRGFGNDGNFIIPDSLDQYHIIAGPYQFFIFNGSSIYYGNRFYACGTPYLPSFVSGLTYECMWELSNSFYDNNRYTHGTSWRNWLTSSGGAGDEIQSPVNQYLLWNGIDWSANGQAISFGGCSACGVLSLMAIAPARNESLPVWTNDQAMIYEPYITWGQSSYCDCNVKIRGQLWDAAIVSSPLAADQIISFSTYNWWVLTDSNNRTGARLSGTLVLMLP